MAAHPGARGPWALLAVLTFAHVAYGVQFQSVGAVGPAMVAGLGLDFASLGTLVGAYSMLGLALPSTAVAYMLYFRLIENVGPTSTSTVTLLVPLFGLLFGVVLLDEPVGWGTLAGLALILSSVTLVTGLGLGGTKRNIQV